MQELIILKSRIIIKAIELDFDSPLRTEIYDSTGNIAITIDLDSYNILKSVFGNMPRKIEVELFNMAKGVGVAQYNHVYWMMENTMRILIQAGIPQYVRKFIYEENFKPSQESKGKVPKVFSLDDLEFQFIIWLITCAVVFSVFVLELLWFHVNKMVKMYCFFKTIQQFTKH